MITSKDLLRFVTEELVVSLYHMTREGKVQGGILFSPWQVSLNCSIEECLTKEMVALLGWSC